LIEGVLKMNILYLTPQQPALFNGGSRHIYANLRALCEYGNNYIDYIGPPFENGMEGLERGNLNIVAARNFTPRDRFLAAIKGAPTSLWQIFSEARKKLDFQKYDLVFMELSYLGFIFDYLAPHTQTICCVHNVEADYQKFNCTGFRKIKYLHVRRGESKVVRRAKMLLVMHNSDLSRMEALYKIALKNYALHPVCSFNPAHDSLKIEDREKNILFCGTLRQRFNEIGLLRFLNTCWREIQDCGYTLLIAGSNPSQRIGQAVGHFRNTMLIPNPPDMGLLLRKSRMLILPDIYGTGMKLRVAEALSYGVPVVGTTMGLRGYENVESFGLAVESVGDMSAAILGLLLNTDRLKELSANAQKIWKQKYAFEVFKTRIHSFLAQLTSPGSA
jgi:glycosyltransferase involved in cell wall biosynthesis